MGTRQSGEPGNHFLFSDIHLLDEVTQCVQELTRDKEQLSDLETLRKYADSYFASEGHMMALN